jgi:hypothetical protein
VQALAGSTPVRASDGGAHRQGEVSSVRLFAFMCVCMCMCQCVVHVCMYVCVY